MNEKPVIPRALACRDAEEAIDYYLSEGGENIALGFVDDLERAYIPAWLSDGER